MKRLDQLLFIYSLIFSLAIMVANASQLSNSSSIISLVLFLPIIGYLGFQGLTNFYAKKYTASSKRDSNLLPTTKTKKRLNLKQIFTQGGMPLTVSLILLSICTLTIITQSYLNNRTHQYISPLPDSLSYQHSNLLSNSN